MAILAVTLDKDIVVWVSKTYHLATWCLHFGSLMAMLAAWGHPGGPSEQQGGHCCDLGMILGPHFESVLVSDVLNSIFCFRLVPMPLFALIF